MKPFAVTSIALYDGNKKLRQGYQKVEFYDSNGGLYAFSPLRLERTGKVPYDCGFKEIDDYLKWNDMNGLSLFWLLFIEVTTDAQCHWLEDITSDRVFYSPSLWQLVQRSHRSFHPKENPPFGGFR